MVLVRYFSRKERKALTAAGLPDRETCILRLELIRAERQRNSQERNRIDRELGNLRSAAVEDDEKITDAALARMKLERLCDEDDDLRAQDEHWEALDYRIRTGFWARNPW